MANVTMDRDWPTWVQLGGIFMGITIVLGGSLPTARKWVSSPQFFEWINPLQKSHVNHWGELTHEQWVVRHQVTHCN